MQPCGRYLFIFFKEEEEHKRLEDLCQFADDTPSWPQQRKKKKAGVLWGPPPPPPLILRIKFNLVGPFFFTKTERSKHTSSKRKNRIKTRKIDLTPPKFNKHL